MMLLWLSSSFKQEFNVTRSHWWTFRLWDVVHCPHTTQESYGTAPRALYFDSEKITCRLRTLNNLPSTNCSALSQTVSPLMCVVQQVVGFGNKLHRWCYSNSTEAHPITRKFKWIMCRIFYFFSLFAEATSRTLTVYAFQIFFSKIFQRTKTTTTPSRTCSSSSALVKDEMLQLHHE